jgi:hypothetical protein
MGPLGREELEDDPTTVDYGRERTPYFEIGSAIMVRQLRPQPSLHSPWER